MYINGSYINVPVKPHGNKAFIAASAPLKRTVGDWWNMILTNKVQNVIMLCDADEERINPVCENYWVEEGERVIEDIVIIAVETEELSSKLKVL